MADDTPNPGAADRRERFARLALPHLDAAYSLARWLTRNEDDAADVVQDAYLRAFRAFDGLRGDAMRPWLMAIVRNTCWTSLAARQAHATVPYEEDEHAVSDTSADPEHLAQRAQDRQRVDAALQALPVEMREILVLREIQEFSYAEIAQVLGVPQGTVMSRLSRARAHLARRLAQD